MRKLAAAAALIVLIALTGHPEFYTYGIFAPALNSGFAVTAYGHCVGYEVSPATGLFWDVDC